VVPSELFAKPKPATVELLDMFAQCPPLACHAANAASIDE
jgi:hypothetical protein